MTHTDGKENSLSLDSKVIWNKIHKKLLCVRICRQVEKKNRVSEPKIAKKNGESCTVESSDLFAYTVPGKSEF